MKGCFTFMHECNQTECVTSAEPRKENIHFCCCMGSRCNSDHKYIRTTTEATTQGWFRSERWDLFFPCLPQFRYCSVCKEHLFFVYFVTHFYCIFKLQLPLCLPQAALFVLTNSRRKVAPRTLTISL